jgi:hypothetical protein
MPGCTQQAINFTKRANRLRISLSINKEDYNLTHKLITDKEHHTVKIFKLLQTQGSLHVKDNQNVLLYMFYLLQEPKFETVTRETVETYRGNKPDRVTTSEKRDVFQNLPDEFRTSLQKEQNGNVLFYSKLKS